MRENVRMIVDAVKPIEKTCVYIGDQSTKLPAILLFDAAAEEWAHPPMRLEQTRLRLLRPRESRRECRSGQRARGWQISRQRQRMPRRRPRYCHPHSTTRGERRLQAFSSTPDSAKQGVQHRLQVCAPRARKRGLSIDGDGKWTARSGMQDGKVCMEDQKYATSTSPPPRIDGEGIPDILWTFFSREIVRRRCRKGEKYEGTLSYSPQRSSQTVERETEIDHDWAADLRASQAQL